jgi:alpha-mannosidase
VWVALPGTGPVEFAVEIDVGKRHVARQHVRVTPPRRWTLYWLSTNPTDIGYTDLQERCLEIHRENLDSALARLPAHPGYRWTAECAYQVVSYLENRAAPAGTALLQAIRDGTIGFGALFANVLTGLLDHETYARLVWPAGLLAREHGFGYASAQASEVPGHPATFPLVLAASGVRYLATAVNPERAAPLLPPDDAARWVGGEGTPYPQLYWWEGPDGSRVLHSRNLISTNASRFGFDVGPEAMAHRLSDWLTTDPTLLSPAYPFDVLLLYGAQYDNALMDDRLVENLEEFNRRYAFPRLVPGRAEDFFHEVEQRFGRTLPVARGDTGLYWEDGALSTAAELATFRRAQLAARTADLLALWDRRLDAGDGEALAARGRRQAERRAAWRDLLLFGEHTWGADVSVSEPESRATVAQWEYKRRFLDSAVAAVTDAVSYGLLRLGRATAAGPGRLVFNASPWARSDVVAVPDGAGKRWSVGSVDQPAVDLPDGSALIQVGEVPALGYVRVDESDRAALPVSDEGVALEAAAGGHSVALDPATGAVRSWKGPDGVERVRPDAWAGLNQVVRATGGAGSALWTEWAREALAQPPLLALAQAKLVTARRERLPGIGVRLVADRALDGFSMLRSTVTVYETLPWIDIENRLAKTPTLEKEAVYVAFPFALAQPTVEIEVPLGRVTVDRDQQRGSCRDWYCHTHWVWLHEGDGGVLWSGPDTPVLTLTDLFRGAWRRQLAPDGTLFAYAMHNYWHTNFAARQGGEVSWRFRLSLLAPAADAAEPARRGWAAADPLYVSPRFVNATPGPLLDKDRAVLVGDGGALVVGAKPADDGDGAVVKLLDVLGAARSVGVWPAAYTFAAARTVNLVEMNGASLPVAGDGHTTITLPAWGVAGARLFTPPAAAG